MVNSFIMHNHGCEKVIKCRVPLRQHARQLDASQSFPEPRESIINEVLAPVILPLSSEFDACYTASIGLGCFRDFNATKSALTGYFLIP